MRQRLKLVTALIALLICLTRAWDYSYQDLWPGSCTTGQLQSPINIPDIDSLGESDIRYILEYSWYNPTVPTRIVDNGHNLMVF